LPVLVEIKINKNMYIVRVRNITWSYYSWNIIILYFCTHYYYLRRRSQIWIYVYYELYRVRVCVCVCGGV